MADKIVHAAQKKTPAARVNGTDIGIGKVEAALQAVLEPYRDTKGKVRLPQPEQYAARKQVIDNLIMRELLFQEANRQGIKATSKEIDHAVELSAKEYGTEQQFNAMLNADGSSCEEFREQLQKDITVNKMAAGLVEGKKNQVTAKEARQYYEEHLGEMKGPAASKILHIMAPLDRYASSEEEKKVRVHLENIKSEKDFEKILSKGSREISNIRSEDLGFVRRGQFHPMLESIAFRLKEGQISRVVRTVDGLHLLLVKANLKEGQIMPYDLVKKEITEKLYEQRSVSIVNKFTDKLRKKAHIEILDRIADSKLDQEKQ